MRVDGAQVLAIFDAARALGASVSFFADEERTVERALRLWASRNGVSVIEEHFTHVGMEPWVNLRCDLAPLRPGALAQIVVISARSESESSIVIADDDFVAAEAFSTAFALSFGQGGV